jgi:hypothetical protein
MVRREVEPQLIAAGDQVRIVQLVPHPSQSLSQRGSSLVLILVGPEQIHQVFSGVKPFFQNQVHQQRHALAGFEDNRHIAQQELGISKN